MDPDLIKASRVQGATGGTSNSIRRSDLKKNGRFDDMKAFFEREHDDGATAKALTDV